MLLATALEMARLIQNALDRAGWLQATTVGDARRGVEVVDGLSMIVQGPQDPRRLARALAKAGVGRSVEIDPGGIVRLEFEGGGPAKLRVVEPEGFVEALIRETGDGAHVRWVESRARRAGGLAAACERVETEEALYESLGLPYAPPELREGPTPNVPALVSAVTGVFHVHTNWSDGSASIADMARAAAAAGFAYLGITDHSKAAVYARGLDGRRLAEQALEFERVRREAPGVTLYRGVEVDILPDGSLDLDDVTLAGLDFVVASVHESLDLSPQQMTARLVRAVSHPLVTILGHPTGRLLLGRKGYAFDLEAVARAAAANDALLEINANPHRLDLSDKLTRRAAACGARFVIDPDAHSPPSVRDAALGVLVARRAALEPSRVLNASGPDEVAAHITAHRRRGKRLLALP